MRPTLRVHVNQDGPRNVAPEVTSFDVDGPFDLVLENHGPSAHVHVHVDDALAAVTDFGETNLYVDEGQSETISIDVESIDAVEGQLTVSTGYGAERSDIDVNVEAGSGGVQVDEELGEVQPDPEPEPTPTTTYAIAGGFVVVGIALAIGISVLIDDMLAVLFGIFAVLIAVAAALYLLMAS